jgi:hypothetical protein
VIVPLDFPVLILGYMRFEGILRNLESCKNAGISKVYLALDGPKDFESQELQNRELLMIQNFAEAQGITLRLRHRHSNVGLAVAVIEGISWFFDNEECGAILEDDLVVSTDFFYFAVKALDVYEDNLTVALVSGNNFQLHTPLRQVSATHYPLIWGWATRRTVWNDFLSSLEKPLFPNINWRLSLLVNAFWWTAARQSRDGLVDSWAMSFSNYIRMRDFICVLPPVNLVSNVGVDVHAVHSNSSDSFVNFPINALDTEIIWSVPAAEDISATDRYFEEFIFWISTRSLLSPLKYILRIVFIKHVRQSKSLVDRLKTSREMADFSIIGGPL